MRHGIGSNSSAEFAGLVRLAGWNDSDPGVQIVLGHAGGAWRFESTEGDGLEIPEFVARDLVRLFQLAVHGEALDTVDAWPLPPNRSWLIEGFGRSEVIQGSDFSDAQWPIMQATMIIYKVHQLLVGGAFDPYRAVTVLVADVADGLSLVVKARWSAEGFVFRRDEVGTPSPDEVAFWPREGTVGTLAELVPTVAGMSPVFVHPVAAWGLIGPIETLKGFDDPSAEPAHFVWMSFLAEAIHGGAGDAGGEVPALSVEEVPSAEAAPASEPSPVGAGFSSRLVSLVAAAQDTYQAHLAVASAGEIRTYAITMRPLGEGWELSLDPAGDAAMEAMSQGAPSNYWRGSRLKPKKYRARAHRRFVTGHILDGWMARLSQGGFVGWLATTDAEIAEFGRVDLACGSDDDDERGWDHWEVLGSRTD